MRSLIGWLGAFLLGSIGWWLGAKHAPADLFYASGAAGQAMYVIPSRKLVIVHFAKSSSYKHEAFLKLFFASR